MPVTVNLSLRGRLQKCWRDVDNCRRRRALVISRNVLLACSVCLLCCGVVPATAATTNGAESSLDSIRLVGTRYNAGKIGKAILVPEGNKTVVHLTLSGVPNGTSLPIHLYPYIYEGTCRSRKLKPSHALTDNVLAQSIIRPQALGAFRGPVQLSQSIPEPFETIRATQYAISVRTSPADGNREIFCGDNSLQLEQMKK
jgi:hypothetical protein